ncbi:MAG: Hsp33 family molecular chaperone HslO [SAR324 cluster bacterium]|nr:Hsp33 family molecular chaperone HslO [SAR324 cluster bacterium]
MINQDTLQRFIFSNSNVRGEIVHLNQSYQTVIQQADYPENLRGLMGEAMCAVILLTATLKFSGKLSLQLQGDGIVNLLLVQSTHNQEIRGSIQWQGDSGTLSFRELVKNATLTITIEPEKGTRYQGIVPLDGDRLNLCLENYFLLSEQLPTRIWLTANDDGAAGMLLQKLPETAQTESEIQWEHITILAETTTHPELLTLSNETLLYRLFHDEKVRLFDEQPVVFKCTCSKDRCEETIISLGRPEIDQIIQEQGHIAITCEFCATSYYFEIDRLLALSAEADQARKY